MGYQSGNVNLTHIGAIRLCVYILNRQYAGDRLCFGTIRIGFIILDFCFQPISSDFISHHILLTFDRKYIYSSSLIFFFASQHFHANYLFICIGLLIFLNQSLLMICDILIVMAFCPSKMTKYLRCHCQSTNLWKCNAIFIIWNLLICLIKIALTHCFLLSFI